MYKLFLLVIFSSIISIFAGCSSGGNVIPSCCWIAPPEINMTGEKTVIERQIVGDYRELEKDAWIVSSVKTNVGAKKGDDLMLGALRRRDQNSDKIRSYKDEGAIGETNDGYIKYVSNARYDADKKLKEMLTKIIGEENNARKTIFERTLIQSGVKEPGKSDIESLGARFAEDQKAMAKKNDWIQEKSGKWDRKK